MRQLKCDYSYTFVISIFKNNILGGLNKYIVNKCVVVILQIFTSRLFVNHIKYL